MQLKQGPQQMQTNRDKDEQKVTDSQRETRQRLEFSGSCQLFSHRDAGVVDKNKKSIKAKIHSHIKTNTPPVLCINKH